eukprot:GHVP01015923.1.p1 GENE.GHVP01015923.1~~GHVP01015923.1.p1  ORF type:complete len:766 (+),score=124.75 GHVP01015923.1:27-2324(+)
MGYGTVGFPRIGRDRKLKKALENYWRGDTDLDELQKTSNSIFEENVQLQSNRNCQSICVGCHTMYDHVLDWVMRLNLLPKRFEDLAITMKREELYFAAARGLPDKPPLSLRKWFDTNYHYLVPEITKDALTRKLNSSDFSDFMFQIDLASSLVGPKISPMVLGPMTLVKLSKLEGVSFEQAVVSLTPKYTLLGAMLAEKKLDSVQLHEPALVMEDFQTSATLEIFHKFFRAFKEPLCKTKVYLMTYYDNLKSDFLIELLKADGLSGLLLDFCSDSKSIEVLQEVGPYWPKSIELLAGVVDGREVFQSETGIFAKYSKIRHLVPNSRPFASCPFFHLPLTLAGEDLSSIPENIRENIALATEKLSILDKLTDIKDNSPSDELEVTTKEIYDDINELPESSYKLGEITRPLFSQQFLPITSIGSFPPSTELRKMRKKLRNGKITSEDSLLYQESLRNHMRQALELQIDLDMDILVHGEGERSDMVEFFAGEMDGVFCSANGWVQSYGSRYHRPPFIWNLVSKKQGKSFGLDELVESRNIANQLFEEKNKSKKPMKAIFTGPLTIVRWSFLNPDYHPEKYASSVADLIRETLKSLTEEHDFKEVQLDEPALGEWLELRKSHRRKHNFAVGIVNSITRLLKPDVHTTLHVCYSDIDLIVETLNRIKVHHISVESYRSNLNVFMEKASKFTHEVCYGVIDVHSPVMPCKDEVKNRILQILRNPLIRKENILLAPDCGLKTRSWEEVRTALGSLSLAAKELRQEGTPELHV